MLFAPRITMQISVIILHPNCSFIIFKRSRQAAFTQKHTQKQIKECALKLDACVNSAGGKVFMKTSIFQSLTRETVLCNKKTC